MIINHELFIKELSNIWTCGLHLNGGSKQRFLNFLFFSLSSYSLTKLRFHSIRRFNSEREEGMKTDFRYPYLEWRRGEKHLTLKKEQYEIKKIYGLLLRS